MLSFWVTEVINSVLKNHYSMGIGCILGTAIMLWISIISHPPAREALLFLTFSGGETENHQ